MTDYALPIRFTIREVEALLTATESSIGFGTEYIEAVEIMGDHLSLRAVRRAEEKLIAAKRKAAQR